MVKSIIAVNLLAVLLALPSAPAHAQEAELCVNENAELVGLSERAEEEGAALEREGNSLTEGGKKFAADFEVESDPVDTRFHVPAYLGMKDQEIAINIAQVRMRRSSYSFSVPEIRMVRHHLFDVVELDGHKLRKRAVYGNRPEVYSKKVDASWDIPDVSWERTTLSIKVPQFGLKEVHWKFDVPRFRLKEVRVNDKPVYSPELEERSAQLEVKAETLQAKYEGEADTATEALKACHARTLDDTQKQITVQFDSAIASMDATIAQTAAAGGKPDEIVIQINGANQTMKAAREELIRQRDEAVALVQLQKREMLTAMEASTES